MKGLELHVLFLIAAHKLTVQWCESPNDAWAMPRRRHLQLAPITSEYAAATALHEIGHVVGGNCADCGRRSKNPSCLGCEVIAWDTAIRLSPKGFSTEMQAATRRGLASYQRLASPTAPAYRMAETLKSSLFRCRDLQARRRMSELYQRQRAVMASIGARR